MTEDEEDAIITNFIDYESVVYCTQSARCDQKAERLGLAFGVISTEYGKKVAIKFDGDTGPIQYRSRDSVSIVVKKRARDLRYINCDGIEDIIMPDYSNKLVDTSKIEHQKSNQPDENIFRYIGRISNIYTLATAVFFAAAMMAGVIFAYLEGGTQIEENSSFDKNAVPKTRAPQPDVGNRLSEIEIVDL